MNKTLFSTLLLTLLSLTSLYAAQVTHDPYTPKNTILLFDVDEVLIRRTMTVGQFMKEHAGILFRSLPMGPTLLKLYCKGASASEYIKICDDAGYTDTADAIRKMLHARVIIPGMREFIEARKKDGYELHIATNQFKEGMDTYKKIHPDFFALFDYIYVGTPAQDKQKALQKPDVDYYTDYLAKRPATKKPYTFFWDDRPKNVTGAKKAGIDGVVFTTAEQAEKDFRENFAQDSNRPYPSTSSGRTGDVAATTCEEKHPEIIMP